MLSALLGPGTESSKPGKISKKPPAAKPKPAKPKPAKPVEPASPASPASPVPFEEGEFAEFVPLPFETNVPVAAPVDDAAMMAQELSLDVADEADEWDEASHAYDNSSAGASLAEDECVLDDDAFMDDREWTSPSCVRAPKAKKRKVHTYDTLMDYSDSGSA